MPPRCPDGVGGLCSRYSGCTKDWGDPSPSQPRPLPAPAGVPQAGHHHPREQWPRRSRLWVRPSAQGSFWGTGLRGTSSASQAPVPCLECSWGSRAWGEPSSLWPHVRLIPFAVRILGGLGCSSKVRAMFLCHAPGDHSPPPCHWRWAPNH